MSFTREIALDYLRRAHEQKRLGHAYLITGEVGSGKRQLAADLAAIVNGLKPETVFANENADILVAEPESKSRRIVVEQIRALEHTLQKRSSAGRKKIVIICDADRLQPQAANAFLKTLEEPPNDSLLLLLSALPELLMDTIVSRCIAVDLTAGLSAAPSAEENELVALLGAIAREKSWDVRAAFRVSQGVQRLLGQLRQAILADHAAKLKREETRYRQTTDGAWLEQREDHYKALTESRYVQARAALIETVFRWWSDVLHASTGLERVEFAEARAATALVAERLATPEILRRLRRLEELRDHLGRNIQETLALESAFLAVFRL